MSINAIKSIETENKGFVKKRLLKYLNIVI